MDSDTLLGVSLGLGLSAAAGLRLFVPLLVLSAASLAGHVELASEFEWIGTYPALITFGVALAFELGAYLVPLLDNALDAIAAPAAAASGTVLMASSVVEMSPFLKWTLAIVAGGGVAGSVHLFTGATRLTSTATTGGLGNPAIAAVEAGGSVGVSVVSIALPVVGAVLAVALVYVAIRMVIRVRAAWRGQPRRKT